MKKVVDTKCKGRIIAMTVYTLKATYSYKRLPEKVQVLQVKNNKVWLVDFPRTTEMPRYLPEDEFKEFYNA